MRKTLTLFFLAATLFASHAEARPRRIIHSGSGRKFKSNLNFKTCQPSVNINQLHRVLFKAINVHGHRGKTAIFRNPVEDPVSTVLAVLDSKCNLIGHLYKHIGPSAYGPRYYAGENHPAVSGSQFAARAMQKTRSPACFIQGRGHFIREDNCGNARDGSVFR